MNPYAVAGALYKEWEARFTKAGTLTRKAFADEVVGALANCRDAWYGKSDGPDYRKKFAQLAYILKCFPPCVGELRHYIDVALGRGSQLGGQMRPGGRLKVLALGAGPGSEGVALAIYLADNEQRRPSRLGLVCVDRRKWVFGYNVLKRHAVRLGKGTYVETFYSKLKPDRGIVADLKGPFLPGKLLKYAGTCNLVVARLLFSENKDDANALLDGFSSLAEQFKAGTTIILMDRPEDAVVRILKRCAGRIQKTCAGQVRLVHQESAKKGHHLEEWGGYACPDWLQRIFSSRGSSLTFNCHSCGFVMDLM